MTDFNPDPIMLHSPTSLLVHDQKEEQIIEITQHLAPEQFQYEFPPKSRIMAIEAEIQDDDEYSFFDECSFTTISTSTHAYSNIIQEEDEDEDEDEDYYQQLINNDHSNRSSSDRLDRYFDSFTNEHNKFISDNQLSPLQLPSQMSYNIRNIREESYDSTGTIVIQKKNEYSRPSSFLSSDSTPNQHPHYHQLDCVKEEDRIHWDENSFIFPDHHHQSASSIKFINPRAFHSVHPYQEDDGASIHSQVIVMKISKNHPPTMIQFSGNSFISTTDEGYDDEDVEYDGVQCGKELPIESASVFLPLSDNEQEQLMDLESHRQLAAIKIQSIWRGYMSRKQQSKSQLKLSHRVLAGLARINHSIHCRNNNQLQDRCYELEQRLGEETAMRIAFEKAMEDMTILMDHQHKVLHERVEQEVDMRQAYERKMEQVMNQVQPLESRLRHESKARDDMESMMSRVLDQLHDIKIQQKEEIEQRKSLQSQLDDATKEISILKKQPTVCSTGADATATARPATATARPATATIRPATATATRPATTTPNRPATAAATRPTTRPATKSTTTTSQQTRLTSTKSTNNASSPAPMKRTMTPNSRTAPASSTIKSSTIISRVSNRSTADVSSKKSTTPLRKTIVNRKL